VAALVRVNREDWWRQKKPRSGLFLLEGVGMSSDLQARKQPFWPELKKEDHEVEPETHREDGEDAEVF